MSIANVVLDFNVDETATWINSHNFQKVGLQFPEDLLTYSIQISDKLKARSSASVVILGDTPYSSCCVDELAGARWGVDAVIHYGNACLSKSTGRIQSFYVFNSPTHDFTTDQVTVCADEVKAKLPADTAVMFTCDFCHLRTARAIAQKLAKVHPSVWFGEPAFTSDEDNDSSSPSKTTSSFSHAGRLFSCLGKNEEKKPETWSLVHLGSSNLAFYRILVNVNAAYSVEAFTIDPVSGSVEPAKKSASAFIRRRYFLIEKAKFARRVGILMGTLSVDRYTEVIARLKRLLKRANKTFTTLVVGRINEPKLLNIPDLDALVLIACPESSLLDDPNLRIPLLTPYEMECALCAFSRDQIEEDGPIYGEEGDHQRQWQGSRMWLDFADILPGGSNYVDEEEILPKSLKSPMMLDGVQGALVCRDEASWSLALACEDLVGKAGSWSGLEPRLGETEVATLLPGRSGIPTHYRPNN